MEGYSWIPTIIVGGLAGWIAEKVMKFDTGLIMNIILGVAGALVGNFLLGLINFRLGGLLGNLAVGVFGACVLIYLYRAIQSRGTA